MVTAEVAVTSINYPVVECNLFRVRYISAENCSIVSVSLVAIKLLHFLLHFKRIISKYVFRKIRSFHFKFEVTSIVVYLQIYIDSSTVDCPRSTNDIFFLFARGQCRSSECQYYCLWPTDVCQLL